MESILRDHIMNHLLQNDLQKDGNQLQGGIRQATRWDIVHYVREGKTSEIDPESEGHPEDGCFPK
jgi:hypothetical protein